MIGAPIRDNRKLGTYTCLIVGGVAVLAYILRVITRLPMFGASWGLDDWVITAATVRQTFRFFFQYIGTNRSCIAHNHST